MLGSGNWSELVSRTCQVDSILNSAYRVTSALDFNKRLCKTDLSGLKLSVSIANPCSKLLPTEVKGIVSGI